MMSSQNPLPTGYRLQTVHTPVGPTEWVVRDHYLNLEFIGGGSFGLVCSADDTRNNRRVAVKKLTKPLESAAHAQSAHRELRLLKRLRHDNIIALYDAFTPAKRMNDFREIYMVTELMACDLEQIMQNQRLDNQQVKYLMYQIVRAVKFLHSVGVIHRDLKPNNIAVNANCELKLLDFGFARQMDYIVTSPYVYVRFYRAPEVIINWQRYTVAADIWAIGCIMAEMMLGKMLFVGSDYLDQLAKIMQLTGSPLQGQLPKWVAPNVEKFIASLDTYPRRNFHEVFPGADDDSIDLLEKILVLEPDKRITAGQAICHPYFRGFHDPADEPNAEPFKDQYERSDKPRDISEWKACLHEMLRNWEPDEPLQLDTYMATLNLSAAGEV